MTHSELACDYFLRGFNCAQSVFAAFCDVTGYSEEEALRLTSSLGGGIGRLREVCGAFSAASLVMGARYGYTDPSDNASKKEHYARIQAFAEEFRKRHGSIVCRELLASLSPASSPAPSPRTEEFYKARPCLRFVESAAELLDELILSE